MSDVIRNPPSRDYLNRKRWAIDQRRRVLAQVIATRDYDAERSEKLDQLRALAIQLETMPHMATTLAAVRAEIDRLTVAT